MMRRLVLVGAGRAHLRLLRAFAKPIVRGLELVLVTEDTDYHHPEMSSGLLRGVYSPDELRVDVAALADRAGARMVRGTVSRIAADERVLECGAERIPFDVCTLDVVGRPDGFDFPGVAERTLMLRPPSVLPAARAFIDARIAGADSPIDCIAVGGGTTGVEAAFVMQRLLRESRHGGVVTIVDAATTILSDAEPCRDLARLALERAGVCFALGARAVAVGTDRVELSSGGSLPADLVLWATAGAPPKAIASSGLPHDQRGRLLADAELRSRDGSPVWAAGDCVAREPGSAHDAELEAALLERAVRTAFGASRSAVPRSRSGPCTLDTGDGRAILEWGRVHAFSRWAGWLKRRHDRRFVAGFMRP
jgi:selenide,water dikinase